MYTYVATGGVSLSNCVDFTVVYNYIYKFNIGSRVYIKYKAGRGILESVVIKKVNLVDVYSTEKQILNYVDTFNRVWMEDELLWKTDALVIAEAYLERVNEENIVLINQCKC